MSDIHLIRFVSSVIGSVVCSFAILFFVGCDLGTYSQRVQSNGGVLPVKTVSQDSEAASGGGQPEVDAKDDAAKQASESEAEARAREAGRN